MEVVRNTTEDSVEDVGKSAAEDAGKVVETRVVVILLEIIVLKLTQR